MGITIGLPSGERVSVMKDIALIGSDERCDVILDGLERRHAQIRKVASRWLIESLGSWTLEVRDCDPTRMAWLKPEDIISMTSGGLWITFEPKIAAEATMTPVVEPRRRKEPSPFPKAEGHDRAPSSEDRRYDGFSSNDVRKQPRTTPPPLPSERAKCETLSLPEPTPRTTHPVPQAPKATPPLLPSERIKSGTGSSGPTPSELGGTKPDGIRDTVACLAETTKAAGHLAIAEARRAKLTNFTLPATFHALGRDIFDGGRFRSEFPEIYAEIEGVQAEIARLTTRHAVKPDGTFAEKAKETASKMKDTAQAKALGLKADSLMRRLGEVGYSSFKEKSGPKALVKAVRECLDKIQEVVPSIHEHSAVRQGGGLTPTWVLCGTFGTVSLITVLYASHWLKRSPQLSVASRDASDPHQPGSVPAASPPVVGRIERRQ